MSPFLKEGKTNWRYIIIVVVLAILVGGGILWFSIQQKPPYQPPKTEKPEKVEKQLTIDAVKNTEYHCLTYNKTIKLTNGFYTEKYVVETATVLSIMIYDDKIAFGDLNNDNKEDAAVVLTSSGGGTGNFRELAIILNKDGKPSYLTSKELGDRVIINSITIQSGIITLDMVVHGLEDPLCCPTFEKTIKYKLSENQLIEIIEEETANWKTYRNEEYGFEIKYPKECSIEDFFMEYPYAYVREELADIRFNNQKIQWRIGITIYNNSRGLLLDQWIDFYYTSRPQCSVGAREIVIINGISGVKTIYKCGAFPWKAVFLLKGDKIYEIFLISKKEEISLFEEYDERIFNQMLSTFRFLE